MRRSSVARGACHVLLFVSTSMACLFVAGAATAQPKTGPAPAGTSRSNSQFSLRHGDAGRANAEAARNRARGGDCAGALASFDAAARSTVDSTIRRDRGLCHEKLGHPFPAIDDYRAYLTASPDAPDAEQIRQRLAALEEQTGTGGASTRPAKESEPEQAPRKGAASGEASASFAVGGEGVSASATSSAGAASTSGPSERQDQGYDYLTQQEKLADAAESSPLRKGSGVVLGPFVHLPRFFVGERAPSTLAYGVGVAFRYSTGPTLSIIGELGYAGIGTSGAASSSAGPLLLGGVELRFPISKLAGDHILARGGLGYERYVVSGTRAVSDTVLGRFGLGYRHVFGPAMGLELLVDGGPAYVIPESSDSRLNAVVGGSVAFVVGF